MWCLQQVGLLMTMQRMDGICQMSNTNTLYFKLYLEHRSHLPRAPSSISKTSASLHGSPSQGRSWTSWHRLLTSCPLWNLSLFSLHASPWLTHWGLWFPQLLPLTFLPPPPNLLSYVLFTKSNKSVDSCGIVFLKKQNKTSFSYLAIKTFQITKSSYLAFSICHSPRHSIDVILSGCPLAHPLLTWLFWFFMTSPFVPFVYLDSSSLPLLPEIFIFLRC
jgi:hypothetical protein